MDGAEQVVVFDTTLRDGEQAAGVFFSKRAKVEIAGLLDAMGVDVIEAGFPASSSGEHEAVRAVATSVRNASVCGLSRALPAEIDTTWFALRGARRPRIHVFLSSSEIHLAHQLHRDADEVVEMARAAVTRARGYTDDVEFSCMDATRSDPELIARLVRAAIAAGGDHDQPARHRRVCTAGPGDGDVPRRVRARAGAGRRGRILPRAGRPGPGDGELAGGRDRGRASGRARGERTGRARRQHRVRGGRDGPARARRGARHAHGRRHARHLGGVAGGGEALRHRRRREQGDRRAQRVPPRLGHPPGRRAEAPRDLRVARSRGVGHPVGTEIVLGKLSGRAGFAARAQALGLALDEAALARAFARFQAVADAGGEFGDAEIAALCREPEAA